MSTVVGQGVPHPRETAGLVGHAAAEEAILSAYRTGRFAHAWLFSGPRGVGKATLAYRLARFLLSQGPASVTSSGFLDGMESARSWPHDDLGMEQSAAVFRQVAGNAHPDLMAIERGVDAKSGRERREIVVDDVRKLQGFFARTSGAGGWRVAIIDSADEMNRNAANALLKILEEPPPRTALILTAHAPGRLLATIRSRCRHLALRPLGDYEMENFVGSDAMDVDPVARKLALGLANGCPGAAMHWLSEDNLTLTSETVALIAALPKPDSGQIHAFGDRVARSGNERLFDGFSMIMTEWLTRQARAAAGAATNADTADPLNTIAANRLSPYEWVVLRETIGKCCEEAARFALNRKHAVIVVFDTLTKALA